MGGSGTSFNDQYDPSVYEFRETSPEQKRAATVAMCAAAARRCTPVARASQAALVLSMLGLHPNQGDQ